MITCALVPLRPNELTPANGPASLVHGAGVADRTEILGRIKAERRGNAECADFSPSDFPTMGLGTVFNHTEVILASHGKNPFHVGRLSVDMDWHDCSRTW